MLIRHIASAREFLYKDKKQLLCPLHSIQSSGWHANQTPKVLTGASAVMEGGACCCGSGALVGQPGSTPVAQTPRSAYFTSALFPSFQSYCHLFLNYCPPCLQSSVATLWCSELSSLLNMGSLMAPALLFSAPMFLAVLHLLPELYNHHNDFLHCFYFPEPLKAPSHHWFFSCILSLLGILSLAVWIVASLLSKSSLYPPRNLLWYSQTRPSTLLYSFITFYYGALILLQLLLSCLSPTLNTCLFEDRLHDFFIVMPGRIVSRT